MADVIIGVFTGPLSHLVAPLGTEMSESNDVLRQEAREKIRLGFVNSQNLWTIGG